MANVDHSPAPGASSAPPCIDVADLLATVNQEIATYESRKLSQLKSELEGFVKKKQSVVDDYRQKYAGLVALWKGQNDRVSDLSRRLKCLFPNDLWKDYVSECVCYVYGDIVTEAQNLQGRVECGQGPLEKANNDAAAAFNLAKAYLDALTADAAGAAADLATDGKLITDIGVMLDGPQKAKAIYAFWFGLLPTHVRLAPADLVESCLGYAESEAPSDLCASIPALPAEPHAVPWLIDPDDYGGEIDCAWTRYKAAREAAATASAAYAAAPDDVAAAAKVLAADIAARDGKILACLATKTTAEPCDDQPMPASPPPPAVVAEPVAPVTAAVEPAEPGGANPEGKE
jgi:hypothetical protein